MTNNGTLAFNRTNAFTVANAIGGTGSVVQAPIKIGDQVLAELGALGKVQLSIIE